MYKVPLTALLFRLLKWKKSQCSLQSLNLRFTSMNSRQKNNVSMDRLIITRRITRSMSLKNGRENSLPIPIDIIIMIFSRLNLKSIARCRCVSKLWASLLRRSDFTELFLNMSCSRGPKLLVSFWKESKLFFSSPHPQYRVKKSSRVVINYQMKFSFDFGSKYVNSDLVNGLICLKDVNEKEETMLVICNPSTGQALMLPEVAKTSIYCVWSIFGYDPIDKQFKVLSMTQCGRHDVDCYNYQVLTLGTGPLLWRKIECCIAHKYPRQKICINGFLYYTSVVSRYTKTCIIVCFDIRFEKFSSIKPIETLNEAIYREESSETVTLINFNGKLGLIRVKDLNFAFKDGGNESFKLWVLEDIEQQEWSEHTFLFPALPKSIVGKAIFRFIGVTQKKEIVLSSRYRGNSLYLFYVNFEKNTIVRVRIQGIDAFEQIFLDHVEDVKLY